jgi:hypothetical protein
MSEVNKVGRYQLLFVGLAATSASEVDVKPGSRFRNVPFFKSYYNAVLLQPHEAEIGRKALCNLPCMEAGKIATSRPRS